MKAANEQQEGSCSFGILEIGCGSGHTTLELLACCVFHHPRVRITGVDTNEKMISEAKKERLQRDYPSELATRVQFENRSGESLERLLPTNTMPCGCDLL